MTHPDSLLPGPPLPWQGSDQLPRAPVLVLRFSYICPDRQLRRYAVLEPDAHAAVQVMGPRAGAQGAGEMGRLGPCGSWLRPPSLFQELLAVLTPAAATAQRQLGEARDLPGGRLQCLRCGYELKPEEPRLGLDSEEGWKPLFRKTGASPALDFPAHTEWKMALRERVWRQSPTEERSGDPLLCLAEK